MVDRSNNEVCDDGSRNGAPDGQCSRQCIERYTLPYWPSYSTELPGHTIHEAMDVLQQGRHHVVIRDDSGVFLALGLNYTNIGGTYTPPMLQLGGTARATSIGTFTIRDLFTSDPYPESVSFPVWLEEASSATGGVQGLYWAHLDANDQPIIHSIPYPFPDGTGGTLLSPVYRRPIIVDQSSTPPYDLLIAVMLPRNENDIAFATARIPSHGRQRGVLAGTLFEQDMVELTSLNPPPPVRRILQFFSDTHTFSLIDIRPPSGVDSDSFEAPYSIVESATGVWPFDVTSATDWVEGDFSVTPSVGSIELTHPSPFAVVNADGTIYTWQFDHSFDVSQENFATPFAKVPPGSIAAAYRPNDRHVLWVLTPDGSSIFLTDGDIATPNSTALLPDVVPTTAPWSTATFGSALLHVTPWTFTVDDRIYSP